MFKEINKKIIRVLDPGSGIGNLTVSFVTEVCEWERKPDIIQAVLWEVDETLIRRLDDAMLQVKTYCSKHSIYFEYLIINEDFILSTVSKIKSNYEEKFDFIIINPPYKKMPTNSEHNRALLTLNIDVPNYYAAYIALSCKLLDKNAQMVYIVPRSFCNGEYFEKFRKNLVENYKIEEIHLFEKREGMILGTCA